MELRVTETSGIPESGIISIRAGQTRRQAHVDQLDRPFQFPQRPQDVQSYKIDVLDAVGTQRVVADLVSRSEYSVELDTATGDAMRVKFDVRPKEGCDDGAGTVISDTGSAAQTLNFEKYDLNHDRVVTKEEFDKVTEESKAGWRKRRESTGTKYLEDHGLLTFMQFLMQSLMKDKPADPYAFLQKQVAMRRAKYLFETQGPSDRASRSGYITVEQFASLERESAMAGETLQGDNASLRASVEGLRAEYERALRESEQQTECALEELRPADAPVTVIDKLPTGDREQAEPPPFDVEPGEAQAYREMVRVQEEVTGLCRENSQLVAELARVRCALDATRGQAAAHAVPEAVK